MYVSNNITSEVITIENIAPSHVFLGLIFGHILWRPKNEPPIYAKTSHKLTVPITNNSVVHK